MASSEVNSKKKEKQHNVTFAEGGDTHMFPQQSADPAEKGVTRDNEATDDLSNKGAAGGKTKMFSYQGAVPAKAGITSAR